jgi:four helix bundle protein
MQVFEISKEFPREETYSLTDQVRRASRSVCANISEAWRKRRYKAAFISKLSDAETEAAETQTWIRFAVACKYLSSEAGDEIRGEYDRAIGKIVTMIMHPEQWVLRSRED